MRVDMITPKQLREWADWWEGDGPAATPAAIAGAHSRSDLARAHAAALEENAALREQLAERDAENSKLRSALEIVHFKREPWQ